jgi:class 3 adenylate cyclase
MSETRKLAAIVVADIVGYSRLTGEDEVGTVARLRTLRADFIDPTIASHGGRLVKRTGDDEVVEFRSVPLRSVHRPSVDPLAHMDRHPASERLDPVDRVTDFRIEREIGGKRLIGLQADFDALGLGRAPLGMREQQAPIAPALPFGRDRDVLDPEMVGMDDRFDQAGERAVDHQQVDRVLA